MSLELSTKLLQKNLDNPIAQQPATSCTTSAKVAGVTLGSLCTFGAAIELVKPKLVATAGSILIGHPVIAGAAIVGTCALGVLLGKCCSSSREAQSNLFSVDLTATWSKISKSSTAQEYKDQLARDFRGPFQVNINAAPYSYKKDCKENELDDYTGKLVNSIVSQLTELGIDDTFANKILSFTSQTGIMAIKNEALKIIKNEFCSTKLDSLIGSDGSGDDIPITSSVTIAKTKGSVNVEITGSLTLKLKGFDSTGALYTQDEPITIHYKLDLNTMKAQVSGISEKEINLTKWEV